MSAGILLSFLSLNYQVFSAIMARMKQFLRSVFCLIAFLFFAGNFFGSSTFALGGTAVSTGPGSNPGLEKGLTPVFNGTGLNDGIWKANLNIRGAYKETSIIKLIAGWIRFALPIIAFLTFVVLLVAGWFFVTAGGEDGRHDAAKKTIIWASIGIIVVMGAYALINTYLGGIT